MKHPLSSPTLLSINSKTKYNYRKNFKKLSKIRATLIKYWKILRPKATTKYFYNRFSRKRHSRILIYKDWSSVMRKCYKNTSKTMTGHYWTPFDHFGQNHCSIGFCISRLWYRKVMLISIAMSKILPKWAHRMRRKSIW